MTEDKVRPQVLTVAEIADMLRVSELTIYRLIQAGEILAYKVGSLWRVDVEDLESYKQQQKARNARSDTDTVDRDWDKWCKPQR